MCGQVLFYCIVTLDMTYLTWWHRLEANTVSFSLSTVELKFWKAFDFSLYIQVSLLCIQSLYSTWVSSEGTKREVCLSDKGNKWFHCHMCSDRCSNLISTLTLGMLYFWCTCSCFAFSHWHYAILASVVMNYETYSPYLPSVQREIKTKRTEWEKFA